jgi:hypothetical protein
MRCSVISTTSRSGSITVARSIACSAPATWYWLGAGGSETRIAAESDPVRVEIEAALRNGVPIVPVLVLGATMPQAADLPESLREFAFRNAVQVDAGQDFDTHMRRLIRGVDQILSTSSEKAAATSRMIALWQRNRQLGIALGAVVLLALGSLAGVWYAGMRERPPVTPNIGAIATAPVSPAPANPATSTANTAAGPASADKSAAAAASIDAELLFRQSVERSNAAGDLDAYLRQYPNGRFAGLARSRLAALSAERQNAKSESNAAASPAPASAHCGGNSDEQILRRIKLVYEEVRTKNIDLFAAQSSDDAVFRAKGAVRYKTEEVENWRKSFASWEKVDVSMEKARVVEREPDRATIDVAYSIQVKYRGHPMQPPTRGTERYDVVCDRDGRWLVRENITRNNDDGARLAQAPPLSPKMHSSVEEKRGGRSCPFFVAGGRAAVRPHPNPPPLAGEGVQCGAADGWGVCGAQVM